MVLFWGPVKQPHTQADSAWAGTTHGPMTQLRLQRGQGPHPRGRCAPRGGVWGGRDPPATTESAACVSTARHHPSNPPR